MQNEFSGQDLLVLIGPFLTGELDACCPDVWGGTSEVKVKIADENTVLQGIKNLNIVLFLEELVHFSHRQLMWEILPSWGVLLATMAGPTSKGLDVVPHSLPLVLIHISVRPPSSVFRSRFLVLCKVFAHTANPVF